MSEENDSNTNNNNITNKNDNEEINKPSLYIKKYTLNKYVFAVGICRDDNYRRILNTEIEQIFTKLTSAKIYGSQLCNKTYLPVNIYKYMLNDDTHIKDNEEKKLICKVRHDIKTNDVIFELQDYL